jgi:hypothetical protein
MGLSTDFELNTFNNQLTFIGTTGSQAIQSLEDNGLTTTIVVTDSLTVSGFSNVNVLGVGFFLTSATNFLYNINSSGTWNTSTLNVSTINASNIVGYQETLIAGTNITITGNTISSAGSGGVLPADANFSSVNTSTLNTSTIDSSGRVDIRNSNAQSQGLVITGEKPTITFKDTDHRSGMIHMNSNSMYFLSGVSNSEAWTQVNGQWPLVLHTDTNLAQFGGNINSPNWKVIKPVFNLTNRFSGSVGTQITVATNVAITGNFILDFYNSGFLRIVGLGIFQLYAVPNAGGSNILIGDLRQLFNTASFHMSFSQSNYVTNVPAGTYSLLLTRNTTELRHDVNDFLTVIMEMVPF